MKLLTKIFVLLLGLTPIVWFVGRGDVLINGIDTNFPLDPEVWFKRRFFVWNDVANAGSDFSSSTAGLFFHLIQVIPFKLGLGLREVQIVSLVFWFLLIVSGAFILAKVMFPRSKPAQLVFVVFYTFNIFLFNTWENVKVANLSLVAAIPLALSTLVLMARGRITYRQGAFYSVLVGVVVSGAGINPSYFIAFFLVLLLFSFSLLVIDKGRALTRAKEFLLVIFLIFLTNAFWLLPTVNFVIKNVSGSASIDKIGFTNWVDSLSKNTSLFNVLRLQGAWDWYAFDDSTGQPLYIPYAVNYFYRFSFVVFSLLVPSLSIISLIVRDQRKTRFYLAFSLMLVVGVFLGTGTHLPTGKLFRWLLNQVPFFSLFRSPWYIFTPLVTLSYAGLLGLLVQRLGKVSAIVFAAVLIGGNLLYSYPLVTGKIFRPSRHDGFYVQFPNYTFEAINWLDRIEDGRVIGYPDDEIEEFTWGYRGIESVLTLGSSRETLFAPLNLPDAPIAKLIKKFYLALKMRQITPARALAAKLNVGLVFEKNDQRSLASSLPEAIRSLPFTEFGMWRFYDFSDIKTNKVSSATKFFFAHPFKESLDAFSILEEGAHLVNPVDSVVTEVPEVGSVAGQIVIAENSQAKDFFDFVYSPSRLENRLIERNLSTVEFRFELPEEGSYQLALESFQLEDFGLSASQDLVVLLDGSEVDLHPSYVDDSYIYFELLRFSKGDHTILVSLAESNVLRQANFEEEDEFERKGEGNFSIEEEGGNHYLTIVNQSDRDISANFPISFDPLGHYLVELKYRQIYGNNAAVLVGQNRGNTLIKTQNERLPNYPEWNVFSFYYEPVKTDSEMKVSLLAPETADPLGTKILYDELSFYRVFNNRLLLIKEGKGTVLITPELNYRKVSPVLYEVEVKKAIGPHVITFLENYSPEWGVFSFDKDGKKIDLDPKHFSVDLFANAWFLKDTPEDYTIRIYYRPQTLFYLGLGISSMMLVGGLVLRFVRKK